MYVRIFNLNLTQQDDVYFVNASLTLDLLHNMSLNNIPLNNIIIILYLNTTLITISNLFNIILKPLQRNKFTLMKNNIISNNSNNRISSNLTICYIASSDSTNIRNLKYLSNLSITNNNLFILRIKHTFHSRLNIFYSIINYRIQFNFNSILFSFHFCNWIWSNIKSYNNCI